MMTVRRVLNRQNSENTDDSARRKGQKLQWPISVPRSDRSATEWLMPVPRSDRPATGWLMPVPRPDRPATGWPMPVPHPDRPATGHGKRQRDLCRVSGRFPDYQGENIQERPIFRLFLPRSSPTRRSPGRQASNRPRPPGPSTAGGPPPGPHAPVSPCP